MKRKLTLILATMFLLASCAKKDVVPTNPLVANTSATSAVTSAAATATTSEQLTLNVVYAGQGQYRLTFKANYSGSTLVNSTLYKDGAAYEVFPTYNGNEMTVTRTLTAGSYYVSMSFYIGGAFLYNSKTIVIIEQPTVPTGMKGLYRYYNPVTAQHLCTTDWEELASTSQNFVFEKVLGYLYSTSTATTNLTAIYRFLNPTTGAHFITNLSPTPTGHVFESIIGYASTVQTTDMSNPMHNYFSNALQDHFTCIPPAVPQVASFTADANFTIGYIQ